MRGEDCISARVPSVLEGVADCGAGGLLGLCVLTKRFTLPCACHPALLACTDLRPPLLWLDARHPCMPCMYAYMHMGCGISSSESVSVWLGVTSSSQHWSGHH